MHFAVVARCNLGRRSANVVGLRHHKCGRFSDRRQGLAGGQISDVVDGYPCGRRHERRTAAVVFGAPDTERTITGRRPIWVGRASEVALAAGCVEGVAAD